MFGYRLWSADFFPQLAQQAAQVVRRDVTPGFVAAELIVWLNEHKTIRPGYTTLQELVSETLSAERRRLGGLLGGILDESAKALAQLLMRDDTLSQLAALKQDAKNFGWRQMANEREKRARLEPLHLIAKALLPKLGISQRNLLYYASLANFYTVYDLRRLKAEQTHLYLLCYAWVRYRQLTDNLVDAMSYHMKQLEDESTARTTSLRRRAGTTPSGHAAGSGVCCCFMWTKRGRSDAVRRSAPACLQDHVEGRAAKHRATHERQAAGQTGNALASGRRPGQTHPPPTPAVICHARLFQHRHRQPVARGADLDPERVRQAAAPVGTAARRMSGSYAAQRLRPYLLTFSANGKPCGLQADRYEFWYTARSESASSREKST